jgi:hypothetical protein
LPGLLRDQCRSAHAMAVLQPVYDRFTERFDKSDLKRQRPFSILSIARRRREFAMTLLRRIKEKRRHLYLRRMKPVSEAPSSIAFGRFLVLPHFGRDCAAVLLLHVLADFVD